MTNPGLPPLCPVHQHAGSDRGIWVSECRACSRFAIAGRPGWCDAELLYAAIVARRASRGEGKGERDG